MGWFKKKGPRRVAFLDGSENAILGPGNLTGPLNGRLTCVTNIAHRLAARGHEVEIIGRHPRFYHRGCLWTHEAHGRYDALVFLRGYGQGQPAVEAAKRFLWVRDLPHSGFCKEPEKLKGVHVVALSNYGAGIWQTFYKEIRKVTVIPNGVDTDIFHPGTERRNPKWFIYASNPNRGLDRLPLIFETIRARDPQVRLWAFSDRSTLHPGEEGDYAEAYDRCRQSGIDLCAPVPARELAGWFRRCGAMVLPTDYPEICSNTVLQALACGLPIITTGNLGATPEWVRDDFNGLLTKYQKHDYQVFDLEIARHMATVTGGGEKWKRLCDGAAKTPVWSWDRVADAWEGLL